MIRNDFSPNDTGMLHCDTDQFRGLKVQFHIVAVARSSRPVGANQRR
jgi:hypothetical protein